MSDYVLDYVWASAPSAHHNLCTNPLVKPFAVAVGAIDKPDARKVHHGALSTTWWVSNLSRLWDRSSLMDLSRMIINYLALYLVLLFWCL